MKRKTKARKPKKPSRRKLLAEWSRQIRLCDGGKCAVCRSEKFVQAHHLLPKERYPEYQFEHMNGVSLCAGHHRFGRLSAHRNGLWFSEWLKQNRPTQYEWAMSRTGGVVVKEAA